MAIKSMVLKANPKLSRQLTLSGPMLLWRDKAGGGREGLFLSTDVCANPTCTCRNIGVLALRVDEGLVSVSIGLRSITTKSKPGSNEKARRAFFISVDVDAGTISPQGSDPIDPEALGWFKTELDVELRAVLLARFEGARRLLRGDVPAREAPAAAVTPAKTGAAAQAPARPATTPAPAPPNLPGRPGRNDPCPCGSGLKYKRCCLGRGALA